MADVILKEWSEAGGVTLPEIEQAIAETGLPRAAVRLRLSLDFENVYEDDDNPEPVLQLVRDETDAERGRREKLQREFFRPNATILTEDKFKDALRAAMTGARVGNA